MTTHSFALICAETVENLTLTSRAVPEGRGLFWLYPTEDVSSFPILESNPLRFSMPLPTRPSANHVTSLIPSNTNPFA